MKWRYSFILLLMCPFWIFGQEIIWENQLFYDEQAVQDSMTFSDPSNLVNVMVTWDTIVDYNQSQFEYAPAYGEDFISFEQDMQGNEKGYLSVGFDNSMRDTGDFVSITFHFDQPVINLKFNVLDVDQGLDDSGDGPNWDDAVEVFYNLGIPALDSNFYTLGNCVSLSREPGIQGFDGDSTCMGVLEFDSTANIQFHFGDTLISTLTINYRLTTQSQFNPNSQQIGIGDLFYQPSSQALPVELVSFEALINQKEQVVELYWETASEINSEHFVVEHALDDLAFMPIAHLTSKGNSNTLAHYNFIHTQAYPGSNYYRLKSVDQDGSFQYSEIRQVTLDPIEVVWKVYPNPVNQVFQIKGNLGSAILTLYDTNGRVVYQTSIQQEQFDISHLQPGIYLMDISSSSENHQQRIIKQ